MSSEAISFTHNNLCAKEIASELILVRTCA
jgi:hypothetical protein